MSEMFTVTIPENELRQFESLLKDMRTLTGRSTRSMVSQAARFFLQSARAGTRLSKTKRPIETNPNRTGRGAKAKGAKFRFLAYSQTSEPKYIYTNNRMDPRRRIAKRGLAKASWTHMISKVSTGSKGVRGVLGGIVARGTTVKQKKTADSASISMTNRLGYIARVHPQLMSQSLSKARNRLEAVLLRDLAKKQERTWRT
jgi:hypothetical protein